ncbi:patatin-like phospholipase domain-containing protein 4 isoform X1 [Lepeophtheirus salmonis]|uniref:patatin-like phospholipase domain-containing protein 4 isoform X1 n=1 Tax=Lepeophtheirus salmonis TaxID=72036 RepID=UPI001AE79D8A|nr:patatin-like phospholipase domain-containing protein 4 isoform X1 [Lepeophtheirus salmonis]XP_040571629.1 patatin-like phospholipase domain-containing protein 4 isoform X1 [Lepeophtheirus salmonis]XP_040571630.1 patatin-like phospholipase domain-containing protein 4 isoform X1 [Lepeophtheirus salmonis]
MAAVRYYVNLSFSGCGFLGMYHVGSAAAWTEEIAEGRIKIKNALGSSAGSIIAVALLADIPSEILRSKFLRLASKAEALPGGAFHPKFDINSIFSRELNETLPLDAHEIVSGKLHISITDPKTMKNIIVSQFSTREELIEALICSCYMPAFSGYSLPTYCGKVYVDGGFSDNQPIMSDGSPTIKISPFAGKSQIGPQSSDSRRKMMWKSGGEELEISKRNLKRFICAVSPAKDLEELYQDGYQHTLDFINSPEFADCLIKEIPDQV